VSRYLQEHCGTPQAPKMLGDESFEFEHLKRGQVIYMRRCVQCHGVTGDGEGPKASSLYPRPRDYRRGIFKFTSTPYGAKPLKSDLVRTVRQGVAGTSMPSFDLLSEPELDAVIDYVLVLTHRGELERELALEAEYGEIDDDIVSDLIDTTLSRWKAAKTQIVEPVTPQPEFTAEMVRDGKIAFLSRGCSKCHGDDGTGFTREKLDPDIWGHPTKAADLTSGMLRGGQRPVDVYRRIYAGINGTPMPSFRSILAEEPETVWNLVAYVLYIADRRRDGDVPPAPDLEIAVYPMTAATNESN
jgi:mono/diheme cytochrome c family protein